MDGGEACLYLYIRKKLIFKQILQHTHKDTSGSGTREL
jgi:hypothetical protein